jgi:hypothetical protein
MKAQVIEVSVVEHQEIHQVVLEEDQKNSLVQEEPGEEAH